MYIFLISVHINVFLYQKEKEKKNMQILGTISNELMSIKFRKEMFFASPEKLISTVSHFYPEATISIDIDFPKLNIQAVLML